MQTEPTKPPPGLLPSQEASAIKQPNIHKSLWLFIGMFLLIGALTHYIHQANPLANRIAQVLKATLPLATTQPPIVWKKAYNPVSDLAPTLESQQDLFSNMVTLSTDIWGDSSNENEQTALNTLESHINQILLGHIDPSSTSLMLQKKMLDNIPNSYPVPFKGITSPRGNRMHPTLKKMDFHPGVDLRATMNTPVRATADGVVEFAGFHKKSGFGNLIIIHHNYGFRTSFGHLNKVLTKIGDVVRKGDIIGRTGNSGMSSGPHLHYEVRFVHHNLDPLAFMEWGPDNYDKVFQEKGVRWLSLMRLISQRDSEPLIPSWSLTKKEK